MFRKSSTQQPSDPSIQADSPSVQAIIGSTQKIPNKPPTLVGFLSFQNYSIAARMLLKLLLLNWFGFKRRRWNFYIACLRPRREMNVEWWWPEKKRSETANHAYDDDSVFVSTIHSESFPVNSIVFFFGKAKLATAFPSTLDSPNTTEWMNDFGGVRIGEGMILWMPATGSFTQFGPINQSLFAFAFSPPQERMFCRILSWPVAAWLAPRSDCT